MKWLKRFQSSEGARSLLQPGEAFLRSLRHARLKRGSQNFAGRHPSPFLGFGIGAEQVRPYVAGDDLRFLDHRLLARTDKDYVRLARTEASTFTVFFLDSSASMEFEGKFDWACVFTYLGICLSEAFGDKWALAMPSEKGAKVLSPQRGLDQRKLAFQLLSKVKPEGKKNLSEMLLSVLPSLKMAENIVILSDFICESSDLDKALRLIGSTSSEVALILILSKTEENFPFKGTVRLYDPETGQRVTLEAEQFAESYRREIERVIAALDRFARQRNFPFLQVDPEDSDPEHTWQRVLSSWEGRRLW